MLFGETVAVYCENHAEHEDPLYIGLENAKVLNILERGMYTYHGTLMG
jgi:hypothetical protein